MVTQKMLRKHVKKRFVTVLELIECLKQIKLQRLLLHAPISEISSYKSIMGLTVIELSGPAFSTGFYIKTLHLISGNRYYPIPAWSNPI